MWYNACSSQAATVTFDFGLDYAMSKTKYTVSSERSGQYAFSLYVTVAIALNLALVIFCVILGLPQNSPRVGHTYI